MTVLRITLSQLTHNLKWTSSYVHWFTKFNSNTNHSYLAQYYKIITDLCRPKDISSTEYLITCTTCLLDFRSFLFQLSQIFWNISTPFLDVLFVFWTFYIRSMSSCCWFFWYQIAESILNYLLKITLVANTKQHHFMTCSKLKSYCQSLKSAEYWIYNKQYNTHYLTYCDMETDESGIFL